MANQRRGELDLVLGGRRLRLCLTLGALAEIETAFGVGDLAALGRRFEDGTLSARDLVRLVGAAARGGGEAVTDEDIAALPLEGGLAPFVTAVARLIEITFGSGGGPTPRP